MKLTKYTHACLVLEEQGQQLVIDPGEWNGNLAGLANVTAIVVTHSHFDHCNLDIIQAILAANPNAKVFGTAEVATTIPGTTAAKASDKITIGPFSLQFYGQHHALVHADKPQTQNIGVLVNGLVYYPGDSFATPDGAAVKLLALPVSGPWLKIGEAMDFVAEIKPQFCLPTHDHMLSKDGSDVVDDWIAPWCETFSTKYQRLNPGESIPL